jgi:tetratricopeptide (TPR) repeat protein/predicted Ser/Thr protein kinase
MGDGDIPADLPATVSLQKKPRPPAAERGVAATPRNIGRFVIRRQLGAGGMGVVYEAFDEDLARRVALKVLQPELSRTEEGEARLLREARAMAQLEHPNVVTVHDVGTYRGQVFIAMQYVAGQTLRDWLRRDKRPWREVVAAYVSAGRGLVAAHRAGVVHRDFKPDNVLVGDDGGVRVLDFGLARSEGGEVRVDADTIRGDEVVETITNTGAIMGTPAYMAPEQHAGTTTDARTDQFSFCVALFEALYGVRPFRGANLAEIAAAVDAHEVVDPPEGNDVPPWLHEIVVRGMRVDPDDRWPSMTALIAALDADPDARRRKLLIRAAIAGAVVAAAVVIVVLAMRGRGSGAPSANICVPASERLAGVWDDALATELRERATKVDKSYARKAWASIEGELDDFSASWRSVYDAACESDERTRDPQLYGQRMACLDRRLLEVEARAGAFAAIDMKTVIHGTEVSLLLKAPAECANDAIARSQVYVSQDPELRERVAEQRLRYERASAMVRAMFLGEDLGNLEAAMTDGFAAEAELESIGYKPAIAEVNYLTGHGLLHGGMMLDVGWQKLEQALALAEESGHAEYQAAALLSMVKHAPYADGTYAADDVAAKLARAERLVNAVGRPMWLATLLSRAQALHAFRTGHPDESLEFERRAVTAAESAYGVDSASASWHGISYLHRLMSYRKLDEAIVQLRRMLAVSERHGGMDHPSSINLRVDLSSLLHATGERVEAHRLLAQLLARLEKQSPLDERSLGVVHGKLGYDAWLEGHMVEALAHAEKAHGYAASMLPVAPGRLWTSWLLAEMYWVHGRHADARRVAETVVAAVDPQSPVASRAWESELLLGELDALDGVRRPWSSEVDEAMARERSTSGWEGTDVLLASAACHRGNMLSHLGEREEALAVYERGWARLVDETAMHINGVWVLERIGTARVELGKHAEAVEPLEKSLAAGLEQAPGHFSVTSARFSLARALVETGGDRPRAVELAEQARAAYAALGAGRAKDVERVDAWLSRHR